MTTFVRAKRATAPLDDKARARLIGGGMLSSVSSSGSEHSGEYDSFSSLSELVHSFLETTDIPDDAATSAGYDSDHDKSPSSGDSTAEDIDDILKSIEETATDPYRNLLFSDVVKATEVYSYLSNQKPLYRRKVMSFLRERGHNAGICKTRWDSSTSGNLTAGSYEFIDVVSAQAQRYVVDLDFAAQFEIARPTSHYSNLSRVLPRVYVGKLGENLKKIVRVTCDAAKRSLKSRELSLPPWRKNRYMVNKWFGLYKRTISAVPGQVVTEFSNGVKCRRVGFDDAVSGRVFVRTR